MKIGDKIYFKSVPSIIYTVLAHNITKYVRDGNTHTYPEPVVIVGINDTWGYIENRKLSQTVIIDEEEML
jgi:hypothetical protein